MGQSTRTLKMVRLWVTYKQITRDLPSSADLGDWIVLEEKSTMEANVLGRICWSKVEMIRSQQLCTGSELFYWIFKGKDVKHPKTSFNTKEAYVLTGILYSTFVWLYLFKTDILQAFFVIWIFYEIEAIKRLRQISYDIQYITLILELFVPLAFFRGWWQRTSQL